MTTYFAAGGLECYRSYTSGVTDGGSGVGIVLDRNSTNTATIMLENTQSAYEPLALTSLWFHDVMHTYAPGGYDTIVFRSPDGVARVKLQCDSSKFALFFYTGTVWQLVGAPFAVPDPFVCDIQISVGTSGTLAVYSGGVLQAQARTIDNSAIGSIGSIVLGLMRHGVDDTSHDQVIVADYPTIGHKVQRRAATGAGTVSLWSGSYADVNEVATNDTTAISTDQPSYGETFQGTQLAALTNGEVVKAVVVGARARNNGAQPSAVGMELIRQARQGGPTSIYGPLSKSLTQGYAGFIGVFDNLDSYDGSAPLTVDSVNASEFGVFSGNGS